MTGPHRAGDVIGGRYRVISFVGQGGMQYVYKATDTVMLRDVALKTPKNSSATKRFKRSAIVAAKVNHHSVAKTLDYVKEGDNRYLIEEFVDGLDLQEGLLKYNPFIDPYLAAKIFHYLSKGLAAAHHVKVVHRDLKPTNIMIGGGYSLTEIKITDFGIAKMADEELIDAAEGGESTMTTSQTAVGALPYMAPEAIDRPREVGPPADVWSIGAMMYQLITGQLPFGSGLKAVTRIMQDQPSPIPVFVKSNPQFSPLASNLLDIAMACLNKDPSARPTADDLVRSCGQLCYSRSPRSEGTIGEFKYQAWGYINSENPRVFFHRSSVYGPRPIAGGSRVLFSSYSGGGADRAHPVVILN
ncbi:serine/threonine protein kinase [Pseudomonas carnis]|uniref:serine/threonine-protein kinase n=1 Tax=Pseudomonas carnis TaxID=2487355 RepID=UPI0018E5D063|nr:serine/threonine-protein kinase [Pseudomonas carnis]MBI6654965.1 serine/threonine protein kinase [Pseudomonas carnis]MBI6689644.1 serine/threonine protein kinase [Pseudomonas carnis]